MSELLSNAELRDLTGYNARDRQCSVLEEMGVPYMRRGSRVLVSRELLRQRMAGVEFRQPQGPRLDLVR